MSIKAESDFQERPKFGLSEQQTLGQRFGKYSGSDLTVQSSGILKSLVLKELIRQISAHKDGGCLHKNKQKLRIQKKNGK